MMNRDTRLLLPATLIAMLGAAGCGDDEGGVSVGDELELITTVNLTLTAPGETVTATFRDEDGDGGPIPADLPNPIQLTRGSTYTMSVEILNETVVPEDNITLEIQEEAEEHLFFYPVMDPAVLSVTITDRESDYENGNMEGDDLPVGLQSQVVAISAGSTSFQAVLRHLPPIDGMAQKTAATTITDGETDFDFPVQVTVQ